jgi:hypothetical protein
MRIGTLSALIFVLGLESSAQHRTHWTQAQNYGLEGPIHSQVFIAKKLAQDPRQNPKLLTNSPQPLALTAKPSAPRSPREILLDPDWTQILA